MADGEKPAKPKAEQPAKPQAAKPDTRADPKQAFCSKCGFSTGNTQTKTCPTCKTSLTLAY